MLFGPGYRKLSGLQARAITADALKAISEQLSASGAVTLVTAPDFACALPSTYRVIVRATVKEDLSYELLWTVLQNGREHAAFFADHDLAIPTFAADDSFAPTPEMIEADHRRTASRRLRVGILIAARELARSSLRFEPAT